MGTVPPLPSGMVGYGCTGLTPPSRGGVPASGAACVGSPAGVGALNGLEGAGAVGAGALGSGYAPPVPGYALGSVGSHGLA